MKTEPDSSSANGRAPITYVLENAYPYAIDAVPLSYGTSQLTRVNVNFHYSRHTVIYGNRKTASTQKLDYDDPAFGNYGLTTQDGKQRGQ